MKRLYTEEQLEARRVADRKRYAAKVSKEATKTRAASKRKGILIEEVVEVRYEPEYQLPSVLTELGGSLGKALSVIESYSWKRQHTEHQKAEYERALLTLRHMEKAYQSNAAKVLDRKDILGRRNTDEWKQQDLIEFEIGF